MPPQCWKKKNGFVVVGNKEESTTTARDSFVMNVCIHTCVIFTFLEFSCSGLETTFKTDREIL